MSASSTNLDYDGFAESKSADVHEVETVAVHRTLDGPDDAHALVMTERLGQPLPA